MNSELELLVTEGQLKGRRFNVPADGLRLGRSSSCEISIPDPALSRNHCLFETRDGGLWVTDLASANGTIVNDVQLGPDSHRLQAGDRVLMGDSMIQVVAAGAAVQEPAPAPAVVPPKIDLGLGGGEQPPEEPAAARPSWLRFALWGVALASVLGALALILLPVASAPKTEVQPIPDGEGDLVSFSFEKVEANTDAVFRCAYAYSKDRFLSVQYDDVPKAKIRFTKTVELKAEAHERLAKILSADALGSLNPKYEGEPSESKPLKSFKLHVVRSTRVFDVSVENGVAPSSFLEVCRSLENFAKSELGIWAVQIPAAERLKRSEEARRVAEERWGERGETNYEKYGEALKKYTEALEYLEGIDPKPENYESMLDRRKEVEAEIDRVYNELRVKADQAYHTENWDQANRYLQDILQLVPDPNSDRHADARRKLLDVENVGKEKSKR